MSLFCLIESYEFHRYAQPGNMEHCEETRVFPPGTIFSGLLTDARMGPNSEVVQMCRVQDTPFVRGVVPGKVALPCGGPLEALALMAADDLREIASERRLLALRARGFLSARDVDRSRKDRARARKAGKRPSREGLQSGKPPA